MLSSWNASPREFTPERSKEALAVDLLPAARIGESRSAPSIVSPAARGATVTVASSPVPSPVSKPGPLKAADLPDLGKAAAAAPSRAGEVSSAVPAAELSLYQRRLYEIVARNSRYPEGAKRLRMSGVTQLAFRVDRLGNVLESWVQESSGSELLDDAALDALKRSQPLPPIPPTLPSRMDFVIEIDSSLVRQSALHSDG